MKKIVLVLWCIIMTFAFTSSVSAAEKQWVYGDSMPEGILHYEAAALGNDIYVFGGTTGYKYNTFTKEWITVSNIRVTSANATTLNGKIYIAGGIGTDAGQSNKLFEYDPSVNKWTQRGDLPIGVYAASISALNGKLYVAGGVDVGSNTTTSSVFSYDPTSNTWSSVAKLNNGRRGHRSVVVKGNLYVFGGGENSSVEKYDESSNKWTVVNNTPESKVSYGAVAVGDKVYIVGGDRTDKSSVDIYDTDTNTWSKAPNLNTARKFLQAVAINDTIYALGGRNVSGEYITAVEYYKTNDIIWNPDPNTQPSGDRAILTITMTTGLQKEYDLSMDEINAFINWYDTKDAGSGPSKYAISKHDNNKGPFSKRTDYVIFNNILTFEVNEYNTVTAAIYK